MPRKEQVEEEWMGEIQSMKEIKVWGNNGVSKEQFPMVWNFRMPGIKQLICQWKSKKYIFLKD